MATEIPALTVPDEVEVVLLDVGGVLASDYWETILLTPTVGLADRLRLGRARVAEAGLSLWETYCRRDAQEAAYWADLGAALGVDIPASLPEELDRLVEASPQACGLLAALGAAGVTVGVISNNTAFWYPKQSALVDLGAHVETELVFLSHEHGRTKGDDPSLLDVAAERLDPATVLVVDDRDANVAAARRRGFHAVPYADPTEAR